MGALRPTRLPSEEKTSSPASQAKRSSPSPTAASVPPSLPSKPPSRLPDPPSSEHVKLCSSPSLYSDHLRVVFIRFIRRGGSSAQPSFVRISEDEPIATLRFYDNTLNC